MARSMGRADVNSGLGFEGFDHGLKDKATYADCSWEAADAEKSMAEGRASGPRTCGRGPPALRPRVVMQSIFG
jgi:hypothetical protein